MTRSAAFVDKSYADGLEASKSAGKLLLVDATASWCQPCQVMDRVTWADPNVVTWLAEHAVAVQIDVDQEKPVAASLGIRSMPTVVVFRNGVEIDRAVGLKRPAELLSWLTALERGETSVDLARKAMEGGPKDMQARMAFARTLSGARRFDEATSEYVWLWQHVLEHEPSMVGVRGSFMLMEIERLVRDHEPARRRFTELRDALGADGAAATATPQEMADWIALSVTLGEEDRVVAWFDASPEIVVRRPEVGGLLRLRLVPLLTKRGRWADIGRLFDDPVAGLRQAHAQLEEAKTHDLPAGMTDQRPRMVDGLERLFRKNAALAVVSLLAARRDDDARSVLSEARRLLPGDETERAIQEMATAAGVTLP